MWKKYNPNPAGRSVGDCAVRAVSKALDKTWEEAFAMLAANAFSMADMPSSNSVIASVLRQNGFERSAIENNCPDCYTASDFCTDHPEGVYVLGFGNHICCVVDGVIFDSWDSSAELPQYFWFKKGEKKDGV